MASTHTMFVCSVCELSRGRPQVFFISVCLLNPDIFNSLYSEHAVPFETPTFAQVAWFARNDLLCTDKRLFILWGSFQMQVCVHY